MKKLFYLYLVMIFLLSCIPNKNLGSYEKEFPVMVLKYMGTVSEYPVDEISEDNFWKNKEEHTFLFIDKSKILTEVRNKEKINSDSLLRDFTYAFVIKKDTIYSDSSLKSWKIKSQGKKEYYYDKEGKKHFF